MASVYSLTAAQTGARPKIRGRKIALDLVTYAILCLGATLMVGPFLWMVSTALKQPADQYTRALIPDPLTLENFQSLWQELPFTTLMIPAQATIVPNFILFRWLGLIGTQAPLWLPAFWGGAFGTFLLRQYFLTIPRDLVDAARVDGASLWEIFWRIYLPLGRPALAALAIFSFQGAWNDLLRPLVYLPAIPNTTLTVGLAFFQTQLALGGRFTVLMAGAFL